jgi:uncharacterized protein
MTIRLVSVFPKAFGAFIFALAAGFAFPATGDFADIPALKQRVTDTTATLSSADEARIESVLRAFEQKKGSQIVVLIVPTTQPEAIEQYAIRVAEAWKIGRKGVDDGAILLVAKGDRKLRIEVGRGLEGALPDATAKRIIAEIISPRFRSGDYPGGILAGVEKMIAVVEGEALPPPQNRRVSTARTADFFSDFMPFALVAAFVVGGILRALLGRFVGASLTAGITGLAAFLLFGALSTAVVSGIIVFVIVLLFGSGRAGSGGQGWSSGGWSSGGGGGSSSGGGFSGGGGDFGGGGASGDW